MSLNDPSLHSFLTVLPDLDDIMSKSYTIRFQIMPDKITDTKSAVFNDAFIIGRSSPLKTYQYSSARKVSVTLEFFASIEANDTGTKSSWEAADEVREKVNLLRGLANPSYGAKLISRPRRCLLRIGQNIGIVGFCTSVNVTLRGDYPWELVPSLAHYASVSLVVEDTGEKVYSFDDIRVGNDYNDTGVPASIPTGVVSVSTSFERPPGLG